MFDRKHQYLESLPFSQWISPGNLSFVWLHIQIKFYLLCSFANLLLSELYLLSQMDPSWVALYFMIMIISRKLTKMDNSNNIENCGKPIKKNVWRISIIYLFNPLASLTSDNSLPCYCFFLAKLYLQPTREVGIKAALLLWDLYG